MTAKRNLGPDHPTLSFNSGCIIAEARCGINSTSRWYPKEYACSRPQPQQNEGGREEQLALCLRCGYCKHAFTSVHPSARIGAKSMQKIESVQRKHVLEAALGQVSVTLVRGQQIILAPGQQGGRHLHPCPVVGYIADGSAIYEVEGSPAQVLATGDSFYEAADAVIANFGNASTTKPLIVIAFYLLKGEQDLITMLP